MLSTLIFPLKLAASLTYHALSLICACRYANGVALSPDESFVAVAETSQFRVMRFWLKGPKAGQTDVLLDATPGFPLSDAVVAK